MQMSMARHTLLHLSQVRGSALLFAICIVSIKSVCSSSAAISSLHSMHRMFLDIATWQIAPAHNC
jgi:hypothetical protein